MIEKLTIIITLFNRPRELKRLLKSINELYFGMEVIIADDSRRALKKDFFIEFININIKYLYVGFDKGLNYKRNRLVEAVNTEYFLLLEEDMVMISEITSIKDSIKLISERDLALVSGVVYNYYILDLVNLMVAIKKMFGLNFDRFRNIIQFEPELVNFYGFINSDESLSFNQEDLLAINNKSFDFYPNFFIGNKNKISSMGGWYPETIKIRGDHIKFFSDFKKAGLTSTVDIHLRIKHIPKKRLLYLFYRMRPN
jgi:GT2 family glycosyltransferase